MLIFFSFFELKFWRIDHYAESFNKKKKKRKKKPIIFYFTWQSLLWKYSNCLFVCAVSLKRLSFNIQSIFFSYSNYFENTISMETGNKNCDNSSVIQYFCNVVSPYSIPPWLDIFIVRQFFYNVECFQYKYFCWHISHIFFSFMINSKCFVINRDIGNFQIIFTWILKLLF